MRSSSVAPSASSSRVHLGSVVAVTFGRVVVVTGASVVVVGGGIVVVVVGGVATTSRERSATATRSSDFGRGTKPVGKSDVCEPTQLQQVAEQRSVRLRCG